MNILNSNS